jgi:hypothetical protein
LNSSQNDRCYVLAVDGKNSSYNGYHSPNLFQQLLFGQPNLVMGQHTLTIVNAGSMDTNPDNTSLVSFDVDWVTWETEYTGPGGPNNAIIAQTFFDNTHFRFLYQPSSDWISEKAVGFANGTSETTSKSNAQVQFTFSGDALALYGSVNATHGAYSANVNQGPVTTLNGYYEANAYQQMLYYSENLGAGTHILTVTNVPTVPMQNVFTVDFALTWLAEGGSGGSSYSPS